MKTFNKTLVLTIVVLLATVAVIFGRIVTTKAAPTTVNLGTAAPFAILSGTPNITDSPTSSITGDVGLYPGPGSGIGLLCSQVDGTIYARDLTGNPCFTVDAPLILGAKNDLITAYNDAAGRAVDETIGTELGGQTLTAGVYNSQSTTFQISAPNALVLDGQGDPNAVFIFEMNADGTGLTVGEGSTVSLINEAKACNVFWRLNTASINTTAVFKGNILALTSITVANGANIEGRLLARNGNVTLINDTITLPVCASSLPMIHIVKVPTPLALPNGPGSVTYDYTVTNIGIVAMTNVTVIDDRCATVDYISGDTNGDSKLDPDEIWHYRCTTTLSETTTNIVTATGQANGLTATDTDTATVVVTNSQSQLPYTGK